MYGPEEMEADSADPAAAELSEEEHDSKRVHRSLPRVKAILDDETVGGRCHYLVRLLLFR